MKITEHENKLTARYFPLSTWIVGWFFLLGFAVFSVWLLVYAFYNPRDVFGTQGDGLGSYVIGALVFLFLLAVVGFTMLGFSSFVLAPAIRTTIDCRAGTIEIVRRTVLKKSVRRFNFAQVRHFALKDEMLPGNPTMFYVALILVNKQKIELEATGTYDSEKAAEIIARLNAFANFTIPADSGKKTKKRSG